MVARKPGSPGRARRKPLKPLRREGREFRRTCSDYARVLCSFCTRAMGALGAPGFPCALIHSEGRCSYLTRAPSCGGKAEVCLSSLRGANGSRECAPDDRLRDEAIHRYFVRQKWIASLRSR